MDSNGKPGEAEPLPQACEDSKGRGYVPYTAGDGAAFMSLD